MTNKDIVIINCHGNPTAFSGANKFNLSQISSLNYKNIKCLILLGCNNGHYDYLWKNMAYELSKKISGCVIASDGTVASILGIGAGFLSMADASWKSYRNGSKRKDNYGWVIYKCNKNICTWYSTNYKLITMQSIIKYLIQCNLLKLSYTEYKPSFWDKVLLGPFFC